MINCRLNNLWSIPFHYSEIKNAANLNKELIRVIQQFDNAFIKKKSIQIVGLTNRLTTKWHTHKFLDLENKSIATLKKIIKKEVAIYLKKLNHNFNIFVSWILMK